MRRSGMKILLVAAIVAVVGYACTSTDEYPPAQRIKIADYLDKNGIEYTITADSAYYYVAGNKFADADGLLPEGAHRAAQGDEIAYNFEAYTFASAPASLPYYTNKEWLAGKLSNLLDTSFWDFEPRRVVLGSGTILKGLEDALYDSAVGDSIRVFLPCNIAYGSEAMGSVPANTAIMMVLNVEDIEPQE